MSDHQDGCEWVNISSGTGPTRVVPDKRPLNGCVCVCVCVCYLKFVVRSTYDSNVQWC